MHLVQLLLPLYDNKGSRLPAQRFHLTREDLLARFSGLTTYARSPASGLWQEPDGSMVRDDIVVFEVMVPHLDREWWQAYRALLEERFEQQALVVRALALELL